MADSMTISRDHPLNGRSYFFDEGIRFECRQCGRCCTGDPGLVRVSELEIVSICGFLNLDRTEFSSRFLMTHGSESVIREDGKGRCLFYENGCRIYSVRPRQCQTFPFWFKNLRSETTFRNLQKDCPGIGRGRLVSKEEMLDLLTG